MSPVPESGPSADTEKRPASEVDRTSIPRQDFSPIYDTYFQRIYRYVRSRVRTDEEAEDVTADVFLRAFRGIQGARRPTLEAWLFRIAHNQLANYYRARDRAARWMTGAAMSSGRNGVDETQQVDLRETIWSYVTDLTRDQRDIVYLRFAGDLKLREIAGVLGKSEAAVKMLLLRALQSLRKRVSQEEVQS